MLTTVQGIPSLITDYANDMDEEQIRDVRRSLEQADTIPQKAQFLLLDAVIRVVTHLEEDTRQKTFVIKTTEKLDKAIFGWTDDEGKRHRGLSEIIEANEQRSSKNGRMMWALFTAVTAPLVVKMVIWVADKIHFGIVWLNY